jgi:predicted nucleotidyltransferase
VARLELFGSAATGEFDPARSDVDFIVHYPPDYDRQTWLERYLDFKEALEALLGRDVDLLTGGVEIRNPYRRQSIEESRQEIYAAA